MRVRLRLSNEELVDDLLDFLQRRECPGERLDRTTIEVTPPHELHDEQTRLELDLLLRVWQVLHPGVAVKQVEPPRGA